MKLKYLLPVATLASVATVVTPLVTSCGNTVVVKLDKYTNIAEHEIYVLTNEKTVNIKKGKKYTVKIDLQKWKGDDSTFAGEWAFFVSDANYRIALGLEDHQVKINGNKLKFEKNGDNVDSVNEYSIEDNQLLGFKGALKKNSNMEITFKANNDMNDAHFLFNFVGK